jgi:hypothetical protein
MKKPGIKYLDMKNLWRWLLLTYMTLLSAPGWAVISGTTQPASITIPLAQATTMTVTWVVTSFPSPSPTFTISSPSGLFSAPGLTYPINIPISRVVTGPVGTSVTTLITEVVSVPQELSILAIQAGVSSLSYTRTFNDGVSPGVIAANVQVGGSGAAQFGISRMALEFDDGAIVRVVPLKSRLSATANVSYVGSGSLNGYWEVADPSSTSGNPIFRELISVTQSFGGGDRVKVTSPVLPTEISGLHMVRLRVSAPQPAFEPPVLYYYVGEPKPGTPFAFMPITVMNPPSQAYVDSATQFSWQPVRGARAYKIEIFSNPEVATNNLPDMGGALAAEDPQLIRRALASPPMAGMMVAGNQTRTTLSASTRAKLQHQRSYFWRIQAIGADGATVGEAQVREIRIP